MDIAKLGATVRKNPDADGKLEDLINREGHQALVGLDTSFMNAPFPTDQADTELAILGIPFDLGTSYRPGARFGPRALRDLSQYTGLHGRGRAWPRDYDVKERYKTRDFGDVRCPPGHPEKMIKNTELMAGLILSVGASILMLGGDHFATYPILRAYAKRYGPLSLVHFDAHTDDLDSEEYNHGAQFYRAVQEGLVDPRRSVHIGVRSPYDRSTGKGFSVLDGLFVNEHTAAQIGNEVRKIVGESPVYLTFDIDFIDPAFAPGTGTPVIGGPDTFKSRAILWSVEGLNIVGGDVVELSPPYDNPGQITALAGATIAVDILYTLGAARERFKRISTSST